MEYPKVRLQWVEYPIVDYVRNVMNSYGDKSHDFTHIQRVVENLSDMISPLVHDAYNRAYHIAALSALVHDMFDEKFPDSTESIESRQTALQELLSPCCVEFTPEDVLDVSRKISWSRYAKDGVPNFDGEYAEEKLQAWKWVSMADWMDAQLVVRARDHGLFLQPSASEKDLKERVKRHWDEKLVHLHEHAFTEEVRERMEKNMLAQRQVLEEWIGE